MKTTLSLIVFTVMTINTLLMALTYFIAFHVQGDYTATTTGDITVSLMVVTGVIISYLSYKEWRRLHEGRDLPKSIKATHVIFNYQGHHHHNKGHYDIYFVGHVSKGVLLFLVNLMNINAVSSASWTLDEYSHGELLPGAEEEVRIISEAAFEECIREHGLDFALDFARDKARDEAQLAILN